MPANGPRGILKTTPASVSGRRAVWDEANLQVNEHIKSELNTTKIDEPKTPFHAPLDPNVGWISLIRWSCIV
jgi:hypothetical protein